MPILRITHYRQQQQADCLAACAYVALTHLGIRIRYDRLLRLLQVRSFGASFYNLHALHELGVSATMGDGDMTILEAYLNQQLPVLASVDTQDLPYWDTSERHVVLVACCPCSWYRFRQGLCERSGLCRCTTTRRTAPL